MNGKKEALKFLLSYPLLNINLFQKGFNVPNDSWSMSSGCNQRFYVQCMTMIHTFISWIKDRLHPFRLDTKVTCWNCSEDITYWNHFILTSYNHVLCQLAAEDSHDNMNTSHKVCCQQHYTQCILDEFVLKFTVYRGTSTNFWFIVLSPIL